MKNLAALAFFTGCVAFASTQDAGSSSMQRLEQGLEQIKATSKKESKKTLTLYTNNYSYLKQLLTLSLHQGLNHIHLEDFPSSLNPHTVSFAPLGNSCEVMLFRLHKDHNAKADIDIHLTSAKSQETSCFMGYLMEEMGWSMHYTAEVSSKQNSLNLTGWVKGTNATPVTFEDVEIHLIEGHAPLDSSTVSLNETRSYALSSAYTLKPGEQYLKRVQVQEVPLRKDYRVYVGGSFLQDIQSDVYHPPVETWISFDNIEKNGMGPGLPMGSLMLFQRNPFGASQLLGQTHLAATAPNQTLNIKLPSTFALQSDQHQELVAKIVTCEIEQTDFKRLGEDVVEMGFRLLFSNKSSADHVIKIVLNLPKEGEWSLLREQVKHESELDREIIWPLNVPAKTTTTDGHTEFKYRLRLQVPKA